MRSYSTRTLFRQVAAVAGAAAAAAVLAACGGSGGSGGSGGAAQQPAASPASSAAAAAASGVTVDTRSGPLGSYLTDGKGMTLYLFASDTATKSTCNSSCQGLWPKLVTSAKPTAGSGVQASLLGTIADGNQQQVTYDGHPLYYFVSDKKPGQDTGQDVDQFGAKWYIVSPSGSAITASPASAKATPSSGGGSESWG